MFSERIFEKNSPVGFYVGKKVWVSKIEGGCKPSDAYLAKLGVDSTPYDLRYLDKDCRMRIVRAAPLGMPGETAQSLFMGMHYVNNFCETYEQGSSRRDYAARYNNVLIIEDGTFKAVKKILKDEEMFTGYFDGDHNSGHAKKGGGGGGGGGGGKAAKEGAAKKPAAKKGPGRKPAAKKGGAKKSAAKPAAKPAGKRGGKGGNSGGSRKKLAGHKRKLPTSTGGRKAPTKPIKNNKKLDRKRGSK